MDDYHRQAFYRMPVEAVFKELSSSPNGLSPKLAANRLRADGANLMPQNKSTPRGIILLSILKDPLFSGPLIVAGIGVYIGDYLTSLLLVVAAWVNLQSTRNWQRLSERQANTALKLDGEIQVLRGGELTSIKFTQLVRGDIIFVQAGDVSPADLRITESSGLWVNNHTLSGETDDKELLVRALPAGTPFHERNNILLAGCRVTSGEGYGVVVGTGDSSEIGRSINLRNSIIVRPSPFEQMIESTVLRCTGVVMTLTLVIALFFRIEKYTPQQSAFFIVCIVVAVLPMTLGSIIYTALHLMARKLRDDNTTVSTKSSLISLASVNLILLDSVGPTPRPFLTIHHVSPPNHFKPGGRPRAVASLADKQILQFVSAADVSFFVSTPEDKIRIVEVLKQAGYMLAISGQSVFDLPVFKRADVSFVPSTGTSAKTTRAADIKLHMAILAEVLKLVSLCKVLRQNILVALRSFLIIKASEFLLVLICVVAYVGWHITSAATPIELLTVDMLIFPLPLIAICVGDSKKIKNETVIEVGTVNGRALLGTLGYGVAAAALSYGNYLSFFIRNHSSAQFIAADTPLHVQATTLAWVTLILCSALSIIFERVASDDKFFTSRLLTNQLLRRGLAFAGVVTLVIIYVPAVARIFGTRPLTVADWACAFLTALLYMGFRLSQRHSRKHSRREVHRLHATVHKN